MRANEAHPCAAQEEDGLGDGGREDWVRELRKLEGKRVKLGDVEGVLIRDGWGRWNICRMGVGRECEAWYLLSLGEMPVDMEGDGGSVHTRSHK